MERTSCVRNPVDSVSVVRLSSSSVECLEGKASDDSQLFGQFELNGKRSYLARGPALEVVSPANGTRQAAWRFRCDGQPVITAVCEARLEGGKNLLVVGLRIDSGEGLVALFDPVLSRVFKAVKFPKHITALESVGGFQDGDEGSLLGGVVASFAGCVAVGTHGGLVYLLDLRVDDENEEFSEYQPSSIKLVKAQDVQSAEHERYVAKGERKHLCVQLGASDHGRGSFKYYTSASDRPAAHVYETEVYVSALKYLKVCNCLAIGYSIGGFQLFDLGHYNLTLGSPIEVKSPVTHFTFLEPENDPLPCFFLWASSAESPTQGLPASLAMYQLFFSSKSSPDEGGPSHYQNLTGMNCRFFHHLVSPSLNLPASEAGLTSRVIACVSLGEDRPGGPRLPGEDDNIRIRDMTMMMCVWECSRRDRSAPPDTFLGIFDINHWYNAQMPPEIRSSRAGGLAGFCPYFTFLSLNPVLGSSPDAVLHTIVDLPSLCRCSLGPHPLPDNFFWPSAISFSAKCLTETSIVRCRFLSLQQEVVDELCRQGAAALVDPSQYLGLCWQAGLLHGMLVDNPLMQDLQAQRNGLLSVALQFNAPGFLVSCATTLATGALARSGVTLRMLVDWALVEIRSHKQSIDDLSLPLLDGSGQQSQQQLTGIDYHAMSLQHLTTLFRVLIDKAPSSTTQEGLKSLNDTYEACSLLSQHALTMVWLAAHKLLPEVNEPDDDGVGFVYPYDTLVQFHRQSMDALPSNGQQLLMIDLLLERWQGPIDSIWGASARGTGSYPPPNLHALLNIFFVVRQVPATLHSFVIFYLLLDIAMVFSSVDYESQFWLELAQRYAQAFGMDSQALSVLRGFWALDRRDYELALRLLTQPGTSVSLIPDQEHHILQAFLYAGQPKLAVMYLQRAPVSRANLQHIHLSLDTLIANGLVAEAFDYERRASAPGETGLFTHMLHSCQSHSLLHKLTHLPLTDEEELVWVEFLEESGLAPLTELLVMYYLQRARYVEAIRLNEKLQTISDYADADARDRAIVREAIVLGYCKALPLVQRQLATDHARPIAKSQSSDVRPVPLSMAISQSSSSGKPLTEAHLITMAMQKITEARTESAVVATPFKKRRPLGVQASPFIGTPRINSYKSRVVDPAPLLCASPVALIMDDEPPRLADLSMDNLVPQITVAPSSAANASWLPTTASTVVAGSFMDLSSAAGRSGMSIATPVAASTNRSSRMAGMSPGSILKPLELPSGQGGDVSLNLIPSTPHSILKVRHVSPQERPNSVPLSPPRSPPHSDQEQASLLAHRQLPLSRLIGDEFHLATPPSVVGRPAKPRRAQEKKSDTARRIRFAGVEEDDEDEEDEEEEDTEQEEVVEDAKKSKDSSEEEDQGLPSALANSQRTGKQVETRSLRFADVESSPPAKSAAVHQSSPITNSSMDDDDAEDFMSAEEEFGVGSPAVLSPYGKRSSPSTVAGTRSSPRSSPLASPHASPHASPRRSPRTSPARAATTDSDSDASAGSAGATEEDSDDSRYAQRQSPRRSGMQQKVEVRRSSRSRKSHGATEGSSSDSKKNVSSLMSALAKATDSTSNDSSFAHTPDAEVVDGSGSSSVHSRSPLRPSASRGSSSAAVSTTSTASPSRSPARSPARTATGAQPTRRQLPSLNLMQASPQQQHTVSMATTPPASLRRSPRRSFPSTTAAMVSMTPTHETYDGHSPVDNPTFQFTPPNTRAVKSVDVVSSARKSRVMSSSKPSADILFSPPWTRSRGPSTPVSRFVLAQDGAGSSASPLHPGAASPLHPAHPAAGAREPVKQAPPPVQAMDDGTALASEQSLFSEPTSDPVPTLAAPQTPTKTNRRSRHSSLVVAPDLGRATDSASLLPPSTTPVKLIADSPSRGTPTSTGKQKKPTRSASRASSKTYNMPTVASAVAADAASGHGGTSASGAASGGPQMRMTLRRRNPDIIKPVSHKK